ncbi:MAG: asparagine synthetase B [Candidatus Muiribacteriaceae bacterium]
MRYRSILVILFVIYINLFIYADEYLIYMDSLQKNHLKAYGAVYELVSEGYKVDWALNYRGGSFLVKGDSGVAETAGRYGVSFERLTLEKVSSIHSYIEESNSELASLSKAAKVAVYTPDTANPWDDAVTLALEYAGIPYEKIYDEEILTGDISRFDWIHLHHEDFSGQMGKFFGVYGSADWYKEKYKVEFERANRLGFRSVPELKKAVAFRLREYVEEGGFLFAMCAATDTIDIALSTPGVDIVAREIDGTPIDPDYRKKLDFKASFAFRDFELITNPYIYEFSDIDVNNDNPYQNIKTFKLFEFAAKYDRTASVLTQNHERIIRDFLGQTTAFKKKFLKKDVLVLGFIDDSTVKYIHGIRGKGTFTFLGGHDPEDYAHLVGEEPTDLKLYPNSPGYRLILNNVLFPSVKKKKLKT